MIKLRHIYKSYSLGEVKVPVLHDVNLHVKHREFVSILGPSGSGEYYLDGRKVGNCTEDELSLIRGERIGFIFQQFNLLPDLTAYENVEMPLLYRRLSPAERHERVVMTLKQVGLEDRMQHRPMQLSGGQQQCVAIARALAGSPSIILADEPTGNLDSSSGKEIMDIIQSLWRDGNTIVLITHDINVANQAGRKVFVRDGRLSDKEAAL